MSLRHVAGVTCRKDDKIVRHVAKNGNMSTATFDALKQRSPCGSNMSNSTCCFHMLLVWTGLKVGVLWPNGWMDQDETWLGGKRRPWPHCVRWVPCSPSSKRGHSSPHFSAYVYCDQMAGRINMPLGTELGLSPDHTMLDGEPAPPQRGTAPPIFGPCLLWPNGRPSQLLLSTCWCFL